MTTDDLVEFRKQTDRVDVTPDSPPVDWTPNDVETALREAWREVLEAWRGESVMLLERATAKVRSLAFRRGDEKVEKE